MQFSTIAIVSALVAFVSANGNTTSHTVWVTETVSSLTSVCPTATSFSYNGITYTATESETITITNCPCTVSKPVYTTSSVICNTCTTPSALPIPSGSGSGYPVYPNGTSVVLSTTTKTPISVSSSIAGASTTSTATAPSSTAPLVTNSGNRVFALSGAGLAGLLGVAAYVL